MKILTDESSKKMKQNWRLFLKFYKKYFWLESLIATMYFGFMLLTVTLTFWKESFILKNHLIRIVRENLAHFEVMTEAEIPAYFQPIIKLFTDVNSPL